MYQLLLKKVQNQTFAENKNTESSSIKPFFHIKEQLSIVDELLMYSYDGGDLH